MIFDYRSVMSGQRNDPLRMLMRGGLRIASIPYRLVVAYRNRQYDNGTKTIEHCGVPVISVGNLTTGGTGKTPIVCYLAKELRERGLRVAIVSRGYGRGDGDANDEAMELYSRLPDVPHIQNPDRVEAARVAVDELDSQVILMDDGFQHRRLHRDLNLVVIDATCPFGFGHVLPRGLLREPVKNLARADAVLITRSSAVDDQTLNSIEKTIREHNSACPILHSNHRPLAFLRHPDRQESIEQLAGQKVGVVCGIGNPEAFHKTVRDCGATIESSQSLSDHNEYSSETMAELRSWASDLPTSVDQIVCTHKDLVKIRTDRLGGRPIGAILIDLDLVSDERPLRNLLHQLAEPLSARNGA